MRGLSGHDELKAKMGRGLRIKLIALGMVLGAPLAALGLWIFDRPPPTPVQNAASEGNTADFSHWAVILAAGDYRAHSGAPSKVFDNGRHDLADAFSRIGFSKNNMVQFSVDYDDGTEHASLPEIASAMQSVTSRAKDGCLIYFTSHGTPTGMIMGDAILTPAQMHDMVDSACGSRPSVIVMSSCYSGQFVSALAGENRVIMTAARPDRTSFGCGEMDQHTYFDDCFLRAMPMADDFPDLGGLVQQCVGFREQQMKAMPPSEPQVSVGPGVIFTLRWKS